MTGYLRTETEKHTSWIWFGVFMFTQIPSVFCALCGVWLYQLFGELVSMKIIMRHAGRLSFCHVCVL